MVRLVIRTLLLAVALSGASLVFADELIVTALILATIGLTTVALVTGPDAVPESPSIHPSHAHGDRRASIISRPG